MRAVLMSIQPRFCEIIASGKKTVEVRKTKPKLEVPFRVYIYETKDKRYENIGVCGWKKDGTAYIFKHHCGKVIGEFVCDKIYDIIQYGFGAKVFTDDLETEVEPSKFIEMSCLSEEQIFEFIGNKDGYGWHISDLVIYDEPRELGEFMRVKEIGGYEEFKPITRPPQSWCYVEEVSND